jgi:hypothetical protein
MREVIPRPGADYVAPGKNVNTVKVKSDNLWLDSFKWQPRILALPWADLIQAKSNPLFQAKDGTVVKLTNHLHELELSSAALASSAIAGGTISLGPLSGSGGSSDGYSPKLTSNGIRLEFGSRKLASNRSATCWRKTILVWRAFSRCCQPKDPVILFMSA